MEDQLFCTTTLLPFDGHKMFETSYWPFSQHVAVFSPVWLHYATFGSYRQHDQFYLVVAALFHIEEPDRWPSVTRGGWHASGRSLRGITKGRLESNGNDRGLTCGRKRSGRTDSSLKKVGEVRQKNFESEKNIYETEEGEKGITECFYEWKPALHRADKGKKGADRALSGVSNMLT